MTIDYKYWSQFTDKHVIEFLSSTSLYDMTATNFFEI